ncbi:hypothetical protein VTN96DRAFT_3616 [Rasamsonia emersonii]
MDHPDEQDVDVEVDDDVKIQAIKDWLQPTDYLGEASEYKKHLKSHVPTTGGWIKQTAEYQLWHQSSDNGSLWIKAVAGAGKSVLTAALVSQLADTERVPVLFFFFRQIVAANHDPLALVRDWAAQILDVSPLLQRQLARLMDEERTLDGVSFEELWKLLLDALQSIPRVYCIVDALDEMDSHQTRILHNLVSLGRLRPAAIKLLMTSRPLPHIQAILNHPSVIQIRLENQQLNKDIAIYISHRLLQTPDITDEVRACIQKSTEARVHPSFLYARLMLDELLKKQDILDIESMRQSLSSLPVSLEEMYNRMLYDHSQRSNVPQERQLRILQLVTHASRPLRLLEIAGLADMLGLSQDGMNPKDLVRASCGPLLEILEDESVSVIHHSFTEFLIDPTREGRPVTTSDIPQFPVIVPTATHQLLALTCLKYLMSGCLSGYVPIPDPSNRGLHDLSRTKAGEIQLRHAFFEYAANNWYVHVSRLPAIEGELSVHLNAFMVRDNPTFLAWIDIVMKPGYPIQTISPLHVAAWTGMANYVGQLLQSGWDVDETDGHQHTAMGIAAEKGFTDIAALLLKNRAQPDLPDITGHKPLHYAALANHHAIVKLLLDAGVSPLTPRTRDYPPRRCGNAPSSVGKTPLEYACQSGSTESLREMMPHLEAKDLNRALYWASRSGHVSTVDLLLTVPGIEVDALSPDSDKPLFAAAYGLYEEIMKLLLKSGANPNSRSQNRLRRRYGRNMQRRREYVGSTPLHAICKQSKDKDDEKVKSCVSLLLHAGAQVDAVDDNGRTPLHYSVEFNLPVTELLLQQGANPMATDPEGNTPLHLFKPSPKSARTLDVMIRHGADIHARRPHDGRTPLHTCFQHRYGMDPSCWAPCAPDWNIQDAQGNTPLHIAVSESFDKEKVVSKLLAMGADPTCRNRDGEVPLHLLKDLNATSFTETGVLGLLLAAGADVEAKDKRGHTFLLRAVRNRSRHWQDTIPSILKIGARLDAQDNEGNGVLQIAYQHSEEAGLFHFLIEAGADPTAVNHSGDTLLHTIARDLKNHGAHLIDFLVTIGIPSTARNSRGQTALHLICSREPKWRTSTTPTRKDAIDMIFNSDLVAAIDMEDQDGVRPIHLAAAVSEDLVLQLIRKGADTTACTSEGRNLLHIATTARQINIIGLLLDHYTQTGQLAGVINQADIRGRTPLHDACRSGKPESVALLLTAGADPKIEDQRGLTPLHVCAEFSEEKKLWVVDETGDVVRVPTTELPRSEQDNNQRLRQAHPRCSPHVVSSEADNARLREIIRLLIAHGADLTAASAGQTPLDFAREVGCDEMIAEMESATRQPDTTGDLVANTVDTMLDGQGDILALCHRLLKCGDHEALENLARCGINVQMRNKYLGDPDIMTTLAQWGYASLFESLGRTVKEPSWINGKDTSDIASSIAPYLFTAARRSQTNLEMIKVIVETFGANVNIQGTKTIYRPETKTVPTDGVLHILAQGGHWWQAEAIEYLVQHGADTELRNYRGETALHVAVQRHKLGAGRRRRITRKLLECGANPNVMDEDGLTPLNRAAYDAELVQLLLRHGADIHFGTLSALFSAITAQDIATVAALLEAGANCNQRLTDIEPNKTFSSSHGHRLLGQYDRDVTELYPVYYAASQAFNTAETRETAIPIIQLLLDHGADPFLPLGEKSTVLHHLMQSGGIIQPFLKLPHLDVERRDPRGQTLLLAACQCGVRTNSPIQRHHRQEQQTASEEDLTRAQTLYEMGADLTAVDDEGNNALHLLVRTYGMKAPETVALFTEKCPALVQQKNKQGYTPFHLAVQHQNSWAYQPLLDRGADALEPDPEGNTALHYLAEKIVDHYGGKVIPMIDQFRGLGLDINARNNKGETMLFNYFRRASGFHRGHAHRDLFAPLLETGADVFVRNDDGETLLHVVAKRTSPSPIAASWYRGDILDSFKFLMELGVDPLAEDKQQRTAIDVAAACGNTDIVELFSKETKQNKKQKT